MCSCEMDDSEYTTTASNDSQCETLITRNRTVRRNGGDVRDLVLRGRCSMGFMIVGVMSIVLGCGVLATEVTAFIADSSSGPFIIGGVLAGWLFALINGSVALHASCRKLGVSEHWSKVNLGFGITALIMHAIAITTSAFSIELNSSGCILTCYTLPLASDTPRMVMCILLCVTDICQIVCASKLLKLIARKSTVLPTTINTNTNTSTTNSSSSASSGQRSQDQNQQQLHHQFNQATKQLTLVFVQTKSPQSDSVISCALPASCESVLTSEASDKIANYIRLSIDPSHLQQL